MPGVLRLDQVGAVESWERLLERAGIASLLVAVEVRMGAALRQRTSPEDVLQDVLIDAWRSRDSATWRDVRAFRAWLLTLIDHRLADTADHFAARKRGGPGIGAPLGADQHEPGSADDPFRRADRARREDLDDLALSTTPSRIAAHREEAEIMLRALTSVPEECREVVRLRLFDELTTVAVAARLDLGESAVRHRFRRGAAVYRQELVRHLGSRTSLTMPPPTFDERDPNDGRGP